ncbi:kinesin-related protein 4-like [Teleopsis dalmanni]|uniref:kinesin-related protein 4-like n=1 Tax=Teleopsis dalmanni TaxID=139649 RepID=UPI0018CD629D|nr:kinesin-related protein 4-like [Teleopsis dalmanni]
MPPKRDVKMSPIKDAKKPPKYVAKVVSKKDKKIPVKQNIKEPQGQNVKVILNKDVKATLGQNVKVPLNKDVNEPLEKNVKTPLNNDVKKLLEYDIKAPLNNDVKEPLEYDVKASLNNDIKEPLEQDVKAPLNKDVNEPLEQDVKASLNKDVNESLEQDVQASLNKDVEELLDQDVKQDVWVPLEQDAALPLNQVIEDLIELNVKESLKQDIKMPSNEDVKVPVNQDVKEALDQDVKAPLKQQVKVFLKKDAKVPLKQDVKIQSNQDVKKPIEQSVKAPLKRDAKVPLKQAVKLVLKQNTVPQKRDVNVPPKLVGKVPLKQKVLPKPDVRVPLRQGVKGPLKEVPLKKDVKLPHSYVRKGDAPDVHALEMELKHFRALVEEKNYIIQDCKFKFDALEEIKKAHLLLYSSQIAKLEQKVKQLQEENNSVLSRKDELAQLLVRKDEIIDSLTVHCSCVSKVFCTAETAEYITKDKDFYVVLQSDKISMWTSMSKETKILTEFDGTNRCSNTEEFLREFNSKLATLRSDLIELNITKSNFEIFSNVITNTNPSLIIPTQSDAIASLSEIISQMLEKIKPVDVQSNLQYPKPVKSFPESELMDEQPVQLEKVWYSLKANVTSMQNWCDSLKNKYKLLSETNENLEKSLADSLENCNRLQCENDSLKSEAKKLSETDFSSDDTNPFPETLRKLDAVLKFNAKLSEELEWSLRQNQSLKVQVNEMDSTFKQLEMIQSSKIEIEAKKTQIKGDLDYLQSQMNTIVSEDRLLSQSEVREKVSEIEICLDKVKDLTSVKQESEKLLLPRDDLGITCEPSVLQCNIVTNDVEKSFVADDCTNDDEVKNLLEQIQQLESENLEVSLEKEEVDLKYEAASKSLESLSAELAELKAMKNVKTEKCAAKPGQSKVTYVNQIELSALRKKCKEQETNIAKLKVSEKKLKTEMTKLKSDLNAAQQKTKYGKNDHTDCQKQKADLESEISKRDKKQKQLLTSVAELSATKKDFETLVDKLNAEKLELEAVIDQLNTENDENKIEFELIQRNVSSYLKTISDFESEAKDKAMELQEQCEAKQCFIDGLKRCKALCYNLLRENSGLVQKLDSKLIDPGEISAMDRLKADTIESLKTLKQQVEEFKKALHTEKEYCSYIEKENNEFQQICTAHINRIKNTEAKLDEYIMKVAESEELLSAQEKEITAFALWKSECECENEMLLQKREELERLVNQTKIEQHEKEDQFTEHLDKYNILRQEKETIAAQVESDTCDIQDISEAYGIIRNNVHCFLSNWHTTEMERNKRRMDENAALQNEIEALHIKNTSEKRMMLFELNTLKEIYEKAMTNLENEKLSYKQANMDFNSKLIHVSAELKDYEEKLSSQTSEYQSLQLKYKYASGKNDVYLDRIEDLQYLQKVVEDTVTNYSLLELTNCTLLREKEKCLAEFDSCRKKLKSERVLFKKEKKDLRQYMRQLKSKCNDLFELSETLKAANLSLEAKCSNIQLFKNFDLQKPQYDLEMASGFTSTSNNGDGGIQDGSSDLNNDLQAPQPKPPFQNFLCGSELIAKQSSCSSKPKPINAINQETQPYIPPKNVKRLSKHKQRKADIKGVSRHYAERKLKRQSYYDIQRPDL